MNSANVIQAIAIFALPVLFAITVHESAHAYVARHFGDDTASMLGRVTLNPLKHIDPIGTILIPIILYVSTGGTFLFGFAKPVPVRFDRLRNPRRDMIWVALAGPASNLAQALAWSALYFILAGAGLNERFFLDMCKAGTLVNVVMFAFNLFPLPPLDGGRILVGLLPRHAAIGLSRVEPWGFFIVMALVLTGVVNKVWMLPLMSATFTLLDALLWPLQALLS
ncbi:MAG: site-2 protease family protein [Burkholderiaceae bacterium]|nr:site-2 protease family protein [Burkholderiaceae bacterium]